MVNVCRSCGEQADSLYDCPECSDAFCVDCRLPADHDCDQETSENSGTSPDDADFKFRWYHHTIAVGMFLTTIGQYESTAAMAGALLGSYLVTYAGVGTFHAVKNRNKSKSSTSS